MIHTLRPPKWSVGEVFKIGPIPESKPFRLDSVFRNACRERSGPVAHSHKLMPAVIAIGAYVRMSSGSPDNPPRCRQSRKNLVAGYLTGSAHGTHGSVAQSVSMPWHASPHSCASVVTQQDVPEQSHCTPLSAPRQFWSFASSAPNMSLSASSVMTASGCEFDP